MNEEPTWVGTAWLGSGPQSQQRAEGGIRGPAHTPLADSCCLWPSGSCSTVSPPSLGAAEKAGGGRVLTWLPSVRGELGGGQGRERRHNSAATSKAWRRGPARASTGRDPLVSYPMVGLRNRPPAGTRRLLAQREVAGILPAAGHLTVLWDRGTGRDRGAGAAWRPCGSAWRPPGSAWRRCHMVFLGKQTHCRPGNPRGPGGPGPEGAGMSPSPGPRVRQPPSS